MELQNLADFNMGGARKAGVEPKAELKSLKADDTGQGTPFKDQVKKQIDQSKAESKQDKSDNNQQDSAKDGDVVADAVSADSELNTSQSETSEQSENRENAELKTDENTLEDEVLTFNNMLNVTLAPIESTIEGGTLAASTLPEVGKTLPLSSGVAAQVISQQNVASKEASAIQQAALTRDASAPTAVAPLTAVTATTELDPELAAADLNAFKSVGVTEKPGFLNTQGSVVKSELPVAEVITNASRMQQVPLATALSNSISTGQNINAAPASAVTDTGLSMSSVAPLSSSLSAAIGANVQGSEWPRQMTEQVSVMVKGGFQQAEIKLNPAHLGPLEVKLNVSDDKANISFIAQHAPVRDAIDSAMPRLREMLEEQGLSLVDVDVSTQSEQQQADDDAQQARGSNSDANISDADVDTLSQGVVSSIEMEIDSGVNLYA